MQKFFLRKITYGLWQLNVKSKIEICPSILVLRRFQFGSQICFFFLENDVFFPTAWKKFLLSVFSEGKGGGTVIWNMRGLGFYYLNHPVYLTSLFFLLSCIFWLNCRGFRVPDLLENSALSLILENFIFVKVPITNFVLKTGTRINDTDKGMQEQITASAAFDHHGIHQRSLAGEGT